VKDFLIGIANEVSNVRQSIGVKNDSTNLVSESDIRAERKDPVVQKLLRNFTYLTRS
jgi:DNA-directed RNA polymerase III subunit RPC1